jgi:crotonobetainyl-CoA:carnitine CoA-transferase CaiB-like acyl-CoA transferase
MLKLRVVELCSFAAGPYCARLLADFGAEVIKIESPGDGDPARLRGPFPQDVPHPECSGLFLYLNTDKLSVTLDINTAEGQEMFRKLIAQADVLIEDRPPGELQRLGFGYEELQKINPALIMTSITPFGSHGVYRDYKAYHLNLSHGSGQGYMLPMNSINLEREPVRGPGFSAEYDGGLSAAVATLAAVWWRRKSGVGQHVDVSKQQSTMHLERSQLRRYIDSGKSPNRTGMGRLLESLVCCRDGNYVILILSSEKQWQGLFEAMDRPEWGAREPFNTQAGRSANYLSLRERLAEWASQHTAEEIFQRVQSYKSACAPAYTAEQFFKSPQVAARNYLVEIDHPIAGRLLYPGLPYQFSKAKRTAPKPAPLLGQHNDEVYGQQLHIATADLQRLRQAGVI